jgi:hypothetical protein
MEDTATQVQGVRCFGARTPLTQSMSLLSATPLEFIIALGIFVMMIASQNSYLKEHDEIDANAGTGWSARGVHLVDCKVTGRTWRGTPTMGSDPFKKRRIRRQPFNNRVRPH